MIRKIIFALLATQCVVAVSLAQTFQPKQITSESKGVIYDRELAFELRLHTNGPIALGANWGRLGTYYKTKYFHVQIGELKHPKEFRQNNDSFRGFPGSSSRSYILGKQNNLYVIRGGIGQKRYLSEKARRKGVAVGYTYEFGAVLGFLKPYYLELRREGNLNQIETVTYSEEIRDRFLDPNIIFGASSFAKGFNEVSLIPGLQVQGALHFDWGAFDEIIKAAEVGIMIDFFLQEPDIMVETGNVTNSPLFINLFISMQIGRRW